ncbi:MAG: RNA polymerase sigma factor [Terriglobales bacterium]
MRLQRQHPLSARDRAWRAGVDRATIRTWIAEVEQRHLAARTTAVERGAFRRRLHRDDLILARACARGVEAAWEELWQRYQPRLRAAARLLTHDAARAEELADTLLTGLYAPRATEPAAAAPKLLSYSGLGSLEAWLCTLLAQANIDAWRRERRQLPLRVPLEECGDLQAALAVAPPETPAASGRERACLDLALARVLEAASAPARLLLSMYFLDGRTLADIGVLLRVHESTVSRRLDRLLHHLRRQTRGQLRALGLRPDATEAALRTDPRWLLIDVRRSLRAQPQEGPHAL